MATVGIPFKKVINPIHRNGQVKRWFDGDLMNAEKLDDSSSDTISDCTTIKEFEEELDEFEFEEDVVEEYYGECNCKSCNEYRKKKKHVTFQTDNCNIVNEFYQNYNNYVNDNSIVNLNKIVNLLIDYAKKQ